MLQIYDKMDKIKTVIKASLRIIVCRCRLHTHVLKKNGVRLLDVHFCANEI